MYGMGCIDICTPPQRNRQVFSLTSRSSCPFIHSFTASDAQRELCSFTSMRALKISMKSSGISRDQKRKSRRWQTARGRNQAARCAPARRSGWSNSRVKKIWTLVRQMIHLSIPRCEDSKARSWGILFIFWRSMSQPFSDFVLLLCNPLHLIDDLISHFILGTFFAQFRAGFCRILLREEIGAHRR